MPVIPGHALLSQLGPTQAAAPHFDVGGGNLDMIWGIGEALADINGVAFLAGTPASVTSYLGYEQFVRAVEFAASHFGIRVATHLDHATSVEDIRQAVQAGFTSVMFDGSRLPWAENVRETKGVVEMCRSRGVSVEGELGAIGRCGEAGGPESFQFPTVDECRRFAAETGVAILAPAIGTLHGIYKQQPKVDLELARQLGRDVPVPVSLHGGTGLDPSMMRELVRFGFRKVNFATGVRHAFRRGVLETIHRDGDSTRPQVFLASGRASVSAFVREQLATLAKS